MQPAMAIAQGTFCTQSSDRISPRSPFGVLHTGHPKHARPHSGDTVSSRHGIEQFGLAKLGQPFAQLKAAQHNRERTRETYVRRNRAARHEMSAVPDGWARSGTVIRHSQGRHVQSRD